MKKSNLLILGGLALVAYYLFKKSQSRAVDINPPLETKTAAMQPIEEPKTIQLDLTPRIRQDRGAFGSSFFSRGYNTSKAATIAPPSVVIF